MGRKTENSTTTTTITDQTNLDPKRTNNISQLPVILYNEEGCPIHSPGSGAPVAEFLKTSGASIEQNIVGSLGTPVEFFLEPIKKDTVTKADDAINGSDIILEITLLTIELIDTSMGSADYGGIAGGLANGVRLEIRSGDLATGTLLFDMLDGQPVGQNFDWGFHAGTFQVIDQGSGDDAIIVKMAFMDKLGNPLRLKTNGYNGTPDRISIAIQDDLTALTRQRAKISGHWYYD